jgi:hypothetical protein
VEIVEGFASIDINDDFEHESDDELESDLGLDNEEEIQKSMTPARK